MEMLRAVLDTNFWLATHVVTITIGYSATFVAGFLAVIFVLLGLFTDRLARPFTGGGGGGGESDGGGLVQSREPMGKVLGRMVYGTVCFATLFSFVGTILGGIWADQSWGRFWGWDPKENGALIIVLWNAILLHARWGGLVRDRGLMNMAIFGNVVTSFSWFGVNMLGVGLHSYGFMDQAFVWLMAFVATQVVLIAASFFLDPKRLTAAAAGPAPATAA
jgi:ABC-type transport system involved in cytochrome c biogenesis permease subunit